MPASNFPFGVRSYGVPVIPQIYGRPIGFGGQGNVTAKNAAGSITPGPGSQIFFVNSALATASDAKISNGTDPLRPYKTINFAVAQCIANNGDTIYVGPGHVETVASAAALTIGIAGVTIIGVGNTKTDRPTVNYTTSTAATVTITAASTWIQGINFTNAIDARVDGIIISAADCRLYDCDFFDNTGTSSLISIRTTSAASRLFLYDVRCYFAENTGTARTEFIRIVGGADHEIVYCYNDGQATFSTAVFNNVTTAIPSMLMTDCSWSNGTTAPAAVWVAGSTNLFIDRSDFMTTGTSAVTLPTGTGSFSIDGDSLLITPTHSGVPSQGSTGAFSKSFTSSAITTGGITAITCTGGSIVIESMWSETDGTGLATMTNFVITENNVNGITGTFASQAITSLGANTNINVTAYATTAGKVPLVLESGKAFSINATGANGTGGGKIILNMTYRVLSGAPILS